MYQMSVKVRLLHPDAKVPRYQTAGAAATDLHSVADRYVESHDSVQIPTGLSVEIPEGYVGLVFARSGNAWKHGISLVNGVGVIDSDFRGELKVLLQNNSMEAFKVNKGDRVAQLAIMPVIHTDFVLTEELSLTERGEGSFGSTGSC